MRPFVRTARGMPSQHRSDVNKNASASTTAATRPSTTAFTSSRAAASTATPTVTANATETATATATTTVSATHARDPMASARPEASSASASTSSQPDNYFKFTDKHEVYLVKQARRHASALVVDALYDPSKWRFSRELKATSALSESVVSRASGDDYSSSFTDGRKFMTPAQHALEVFELRPSAIDRVACVAPRLASDPQQLALRSHTLLARTRVRCKLDDFMRWMTTRRRAVYQGMMNTLHEGHLRHSDVFSGYDVAQPQFENELEQFALKYFIVEPPAPASALETLRHRKSSSTDADGASDAKGFARSATKRTLQFLRRKSSTDAQDPTEMQQEQALSQSSSSASSAEGRIHFCMGEYATVRPGVVHADAKLTDPRIGIISYHSVEDPELLQLCNSVAKKTTPRDVRHCTSRTLMQYSGIVAYPVVSDDDDGADFLEVVIKVSCFDARGLSPQKRASMFHFIAGFRNLSHMMLVMRLRASPFLTTTNWVADERRKCCLVCQQRFSSLRRRHHCRLCGEVTCAKCSAVHQVRLVKDAKASLRICLLCVQGVERPKWKELEVADASTREKHQIPHEPVATTTEEINEQVHEEELEDIEERETEPLQLLELSLTKEVTKPPSTPSMPSKASPEDPLLHSHATVSSSSGSESNLDSTVRDFHDSAFHLPITKSSPQSFGKPKSVLLAEDLGSLHESSVLTEDDDHVDPFDAPRPCSPATGSVQPLGYYDDPDSDISDIEIVERPGSSIRRISSLGDDEDEEEDTEDEDYARLRALAAYGFLETDGIMPEDLTLQTFVKEAAQALDCAIAAIGYVDASRDMVSAAYSASPLCAVPRGVVPKQYSLTWDVMQRCHGSKPSTHAVVLDATKDAALKRNHFVLDTPFVRFLVGVPIRAWNGVVIGALMVADIQPRSGVSNDDLLTLKTHAALVETWLENKRTELTNARVAARGKTQNHAEQLHDRLAEMLHTSYQTNLELQMRGMQMQHQGSVPNITKPTKRSSATPTVRHVLF